MLHVLAKTMVRIAIMCRLVGHKRSRRRARRAGETWKSECVYCHTPLLRIGPKNWQVLPVQPELHQH